MHNALNSRLKALRKEMEIEEDDISIYEKVKELILDGSTIKTITADEGMELEKFKNLTKLSLNCTGLTSLVNFPEIPTLRVLELTDNYISDPIVFTLIPKLFPNLRILQMGGNHLKNPEDVKLLSSMMSLVALGLAMNPMASLKGYREKIFAQLPNLEILDQMDCSGVEQNLSSDAEDEEDENEYDQEGDEEDLLKKFYETEYKSEDEEDDDEFVPAEEQEEDEIDEEEEEDIDEYEDDYEGDGTATSSGKRVLEPSEASAASRPKLE